MKTNENYDIKRIIEYISILDEYEIQLANKIEDERLNKEAVDDKYQSEEKKLLVKALTVLGIDLAIGFTGGAVGGLDDGIRFGFSILLLTIFPVSYFLGEGLTVSSQRNDDIITRKLIIEHAEKTLEKAKELSLKLSSKLIRECDNQNIIKDNYLKLISKRSAMSENDDTTLIDSVISEYYNKINNYKTKDEVKELNLQDYIINVEDVIEGVNNEFYSDNSTENLNKENGYTRKRKLN